MTTYTTAINSTENAIAIFQQLPIDEQLALLWYVYEAMGDSITPAAPGAAADEIAAGLFDQVKVLEQPQQLEVMRAIANGDQNSLISREYGAFSQNTRLAFWYFLAQGMDAGTIIPMPEDYSLSDQAADLLAALKSSDFEGQITILRNAVGAMGGEPKPGSDI